MAAGPIADRYAHAWIKAAATPAEYEAIVADCAQLKTLIADSADFNRFIASPLIARDTQAKTIEALAAKAGWHSLTQALLGVLVKNRRLAALPSIISAARTRMDVRANKVSARVVTATPLDTSKKAALETALAKTVGKSVDVTIETDPSLLGGMVIRVGSTLIDDSVKTKMDRLQRQLLGTQAA